MKVKSLVKAMKTLLVSRGPQIATGVGLAAVFIASIKAVKKTPEALEKIEEKKEELGKENLTVKETVEATWKCYIFASLLFLFGATAIIYGHNVTARRAAAFATAYSLSEETLKECTEAAKVVVGDKKEKDIRDEASKHRMEQNLPTDPNGIIETGHGNHMCLCYDLLSKKYFWGDPDWVKRCFYELNEELRNEHVVTVNEYWQKFKIPQTQIGDLLRWCIDNGYIEPDYTYGPVESGPFEGMPCMMIGFYYNNLPEYAYKA